LLALKFFLYWISQLGSSGSYLIQGVPLNLSNNSWMMFIRSGSAGKANIMEGGSIGNFETKVRMNMRLILNYYWDRALWNSRPNSVRVSFVWMGKGRRLQNKGRYLGANCSLAFWMVLTASCNVKIDSDDNTRSSHTSCKMHWVDCGIFENLLFSITNM
jgi:hypothetical protein